LRESLDPHGHPFPSQPHVPVLLESARQQLDAASSSEQKAEIAERIRQLESFQHEMQNFVPVLPTVTFGKTYVIKDKAHDLHVEFHGRAHTAGDVVVFCPQKRVVATGDMVLGTLPFLADSFPMEWPKTIDSVAKLGFDYVAGGHGAVQHGRQRMTSQRNYIEELAVRVEAGKKSGQSLGDIQKSMPMASIKALEADGYGELVRAGRDEAAMQAAVNTNIEHVFTRLGQRTLPDRILVRTDFLRTTGLFLHRHGFQSRVDIVLPPGHAPRLVQPLAERSRSHVERCARIDHAFGGLHRPDQANRGY
jgi:glyoxylase-like metal-dependent hydrolase (beta-lactamase superfamily II)